MFRSVRFRYVCFWIFAIFLFKTTSIFYYDLQDRSIDQTRSSLPFEIVKIRSTNENSSIESLRKFVEEKNFQQKMFNRNLFLSNQTRYILLVQVHKRVVYLKKFIEMLRVVDQINETLLVFSHDFIDSNIDELVMSIDFVPVIQIFYPFSQQLYPNEFPGLDPNDCPRDISRHQ